MIWGKVDDSLLKLSSKNHAFIILPNNWLWFHRLHQITLFTTEAGFLSLKGTLDVTALEQASAESVLRHENSHCTRDVRWTTGAGLLPTTRRYR